QLEARDRIQANRRAIWERYSNGLRCWAQRAGVCLPAVPEHCDQSFHMFYLLMPSPALRDGLIAHLKQRDIAAVFHYQPLHLSEMGRKFGGRVGDCPVTESFSDRLVRLPFYNELDAPTQDRIMNIIEEFSFSQKAAVNA